MSELLACPFCGTTDLRRHSDTNKPRLYHPSRKGYSGVRCRLSMVGSPFNIHDWNTRVSPREQQLEAALKVAFIALRSTCRRCGGCGFVMVGDAGEGCDCEGFGESRETCEAIKAIDEALEPK